jgi:hypothetical protein
VNVLVNLCHALLKELMHSGPQLWLSSTVTVDLIITICMLLIVRYIFLFFMFISQGSQLRHARAQACFGKTRDHVSGFIRLTIQTGLLTLGLALLTIVLGLQTPGGTWFLP